MYNAVMRKTRKTGVLRYLHQLGQTQILSHTYLCAVQTNATVYKFIHTLITQRRGAVATLSNKKDVAQMAN